MRGGKYNFSVAKPDPSAESNRKSPGSQSKKTNGVERKKIKRPHNFKTDNWYGKMAPSMAISIKQSGHKRANGKNVVLWGNIT